MKTDSTTQHKSSTSETIVKDGLVFQLSDTGATLVRAEEVAAELRIPSTVSGIPVTGIEDEVFHNNLEILEVEIPAGVERIGVRAFKGCSNLKLVRLPFDLTRIEAEAFAECTALTSLPHFVATGPADERKILRTIVEDSLPVTLSFIGEAAFKDCASLTHVTIPFKIKSIPASAYAGCASLKTLWLNSGLEEIAENAFAGCDALASVRIPESVVNLGKESLPARTVVVCTAGSGADEFAKTEGLQRRLGVLPSTPIVSAFGATDGFPVERVLRSSEALRGFLDLYENRPALVETKPRKTKGFDGSVEPSRFELQDGVYRLKEEAAPGDVTISMVGDLMCGFRQQGRALVDGVYDFTENFKHVKPLFEKADFSIGNLEAMFSDSYPYMHERIYADDRPHLNSPFAYLAAVRNSGFDMVVNAQNHKYDVGARGVLETLDSVNRAELIHAGLYAGAHESRFTLVEIRGIKFAVLAFLDPARQRMKQVNFTADGLEAMASLLDAGKVNAQIAEAKAAGAEFILAYCHWGSEYTSVITQRQHDFAKMVVDAGADYIFGSHSHCPQHYTVMLSADGRRVPVVYSGGNFVSDIQRKKPITQDTFIGALTLSRAEDGRVFIKNDGFVPAQIVDHLEVRGFVSTIPTETLSKADLNYSVLDVVADEHRLRDTMGKLYQELDVNFVPKQKKTEASDATDELIAKFTVREPRFTRYPHTRKQYLDAEESQRFIFDETDGVWKDTQSRIRNEAVIMCGGSIFYDRALEESAQLDNAYDFRPAFKSLRSLIGQSDLAVASISSIVAPEYPALLKLDSKHVSGHYVNARAEYLDGVKFAGFDCVALSNPYNLDAGVRGLLSTEKSALDSNLIPSGLGVNKTPVIEVNGVRIALLSYSMDTYRSRTMTSHEGATTLLNAFTPEAVQQSVASAKQQGAKFILGYLDCRSSIKQYSRAERLEAAKSMADAGADFVVCTRPLVLSRHYRHATPDGRSVPISTSLGTLVSGTVNPKHSESAVLKLVVRVTADGTVDVDESYVPIQRYTPGFGNFPASVPTHAYYDSSVEKESIAETGKRVASLLGAGIAVDRSRTVKVNDRFQRNLTPSDICKTLGVDFSEKDQARLAVAMDARIPGIVTRKGDVKPGSVVALVKHTSSRRHLDQMTAADAIKRGAVFVIADKPQANIPTLVVEKPWLAYTKLMRRIRRRYSPITVAITGTAGKTTTKELMGHVFDNHYQTMHVAGNNNTLTTASLVLQQLRRSDEAYIQEVNGGTPRSASQVSRLIAPDIAVITSIGEGHLDQMGSIENIITGKLQIIDGLKPEGVLIINHDNEYLKDVDVPVRTIRYSLSDTNCEYHARNIRSTGSSLEFEVVSPQGVFEAVIHTQGTHNISNALAVFAAAEISGIPAHKIISGLSRYQPASVRQNLIEVGGYRLLIDAYNSNILSMRLALEALTELPEISGGRRVVVMGDMGEQGDKVQENHEEIGRLIGSLPVDLLLSMGDGAKYAAEQARLAGTEVLHLPDAEQLMLAIQGSIRPGDSILFKAAGSVNLPVNVIYPLFGSVV